MAVYIDPDWTGTQSGTEAQPYNTFVGLNWSADDVFLVKGGSTLTETITIGRNGTAGTPLVISSYGTGRFIVDCAPTRQDGIRKVGAEYIEIHNFDVRNAYYDGVSVDQKTIHGGIYLSQTTTASMNGCLVQNGIVRDCGYDGISFMAERGETSWLDCTDVKQLNCQAYNCGGAGVSVRMKSSGGIVQRGNYATGCGGVDNQWGVYIAPYGTKIRSDLWDNQGGNVWRWEIVNGLVNNQPIESVFYTGRSTTSGPLALVKGTSITPALNEWYWATPYLYINVLESPDNRSVIANFARMIGAEQSYNVAEDTLGTDGVGIGLDHGVERTNVFGNISRNNGRGFSDHVGLGCNFYNNLAINNTNVGINCHSVTESPFNPADRNKIYNNTIIGSTTGIGFSNSTMIDVYNNIIVADLDMENSHTVDVNEWNDGNNQLFVTTSNFTGNNQVGDPLVAEDYSLTPDSPCIGAAGSVVSDKDNRGTNKKNFKNDIGAIWFDRHTDSTDDILLASGEEL